MMKLRGVAASSGMAVGPAFLYRHAHRHFERHKIADSAAECDRLSDALRRARQELDVIYEQALQETGNEIASIFQFQMLVLEDPECLTRVQSKIQGHCITAEAALDEVGEEYIKILEGMENEYFRDRAVDVRDVIGRVIRILLPVEDGEHKKLKEPSIVLAEDLTPSDTIALDKSLVLGFCVAHGGPTSHTAILARELGLPAAVGLGDGLLGIREGSTLVLDGSNGILIVSPEQSELLHYQSLSESRKSKARAIREEAKDPVYAQDGRRIEVTVNVGSVEGARSGLEYGAEGVGLLRTEFLYMGRSHLPTEEEQYRVYREIADVFGDMPVILRTLDIGGDKEVPCLHLPQELNPFLGLRGIRLCLARPDIFEPQLRAALRVMAERNLKIMFPMITTLAELRLAKAMLETCRSGLIREGRLVPNQCEVGIMVEVPATAILADQFAPEVDFFSIGTNDLSQYVMAADRTNNAVSALAESFSPAILRLVQETIRAAHLHGKWVGMCGEFAAEPLATPILLGLGLDKFSMNPSSIPLVKQLIRSISIPEAQEIARVSLQLRDAQEVKTLVRDRVAGLNV